MNPPVFFDPPTAFRQRVQELSKREGGPRAPDARLLLNVELTFALAEFLGFDDEPVTALWVLLSGTLLREPRLQRLTPEQRRAVANVRQIVPYAPRFAWQGALRDYLQIAAELRSYHFSLIEQPVTIIHNAKKAGEGFHELHATIYQECLTANLPWHYRPVPRPASADKVYRFSALAHDAQPQPQVLHATLEVVFAAEELAQLPAFNSPWVSEPPPKVPFVVAMEQLGAVAEYLDAREAQLQQRYGYVPQNWVRRFGQIDLQRVHDTGVEPLAELRIENFTHIAGMVASGKSTLSMLVAAYLIRHEPGRRMTMVVGDVQSALTVANQLNAWFREDPAAEPPVAVPLLGRSNRDAQLRGFYGSDDYRQHCRRQQPHWGERWLSPLCPLQADVAEVEVTQLLSGQLIQAGKEPCQTLRERQVESRKLRRKQRQTATAEPLEKKARHSCPYLPVCPQYQLYRDMPAATIWVTTPGALASSTLPPQLENRPIKLGEFVHEQSDLVIFDEADTVMKWFDDHYAQELQLTGGGRGILDTITLPTEQHAVNSRVMPSGTQRWVGAERNAQQAVTSVLTLLDHARGPGFLHEWVAHHQFTPLSLFYRLARLVAGVPEYDAADVPEAERHRRVEATEAVMQHFSALLDESDPLRLPLYSELTGAVRRLGQLLQRINSTGENAMDDDIHAECESWLRDCCPPAGPPATEALGRLAHRLQFALTVALLDRHSRIVFYEWDNRPTDIQDGSPAFRRNGAMQGLLPLPLTGRQFGTYYARGRQGEGDRPGSQADQGLSIFAYTNVGRYYVLHFHDLLTDLTGRTGPSVLAMSGTSYLEASTAFHVGRPQALLRPAEAAVASIRQSRFAFLPQYDRQGKAVRLSGARQRDKPGLIYELIRGLVGREGRGQLGELLAELARLERDEPGQWTDRGRVLLFVNSYEQAQWAADALRLQWPAQRDHIKHLTTGREETTPEGALRRTDIEQFAHTGGRILLAPLNAVGRGFNILNERGQAAFGAVYFLTRPYPHPHDAQAVAQEMNRRTLDWLDDEAFVAWEEDGLLGKAEAARRRAVKYWHLAESRSYYRTLQHDEELRAYPRQDLAATTIGYVIQAVGRLLRGGVPFRAFFVDAAWAPGNARGAEAPEPDTPSASLLAAMIELLTNYVADDFISHELYEPLAYALDRIDGFQWQPDAPKRKSKNG